MKLTWNPLKVALCSLLAGGLMLVHPDITFAQNRGGGGGSRSSGSRGSSRGQSFSGQRGGGGQSFAAPRGSSGGRAFSGGGRTFSNQRGFSRGERGFGDRGGLRFGFYGGPYRSYYGYGGYYGYPYYGAYCNPNGYYDAWGRWYPDPRCSYTPYAPYNYYGY